MTLIRRAFKKDTQDKRKYVIPTDGWEVGFFSWLTGENQILGSKSEQWPCKFVKGDEKEAGSATVFRFVPNAPDDHLRAIIDSNIQKYRFGYSHSSPTMEASVEYNPPYDKDAW